MPQPRRDSGITLFELLVVLTIMAVLASFVGVSMSASLRERAYGHAVDRLAMDLRRSRLDARDERRQQTLRVLPDGYRIDGRDLTRRWPDGVTARWAIERGGRWFPVDMVRVTDAAVPFLHLRVEISRAEELRTVSMEPISGRVRHD